MMSNYDIGYVNSNKFTNDLVEKSKVKYGEEKVKFEILDALIRYYEAEHGRVNNFGQNQQTTTTANNLMPVQDRFCNSRCTKQKQNVQNICCLRNALCFTLCSEKQSLNYALRRKKLHFSSRSFM